MALCVGCATARWSVVKLFRGPGESLEAFPEAVWEEYDCEQPEVGPSSSSRENELMPERVTPGGDFGHRFVYVMCPDLPTEVVQGQLSTRIRFRGSPIVSANGSRSMRSSRVAGWWTPSCIFRNTPNPASTPTSSNLTATRWYSKEPDFRGRDALSPPESSETAAPRVIDQTAE